MANQLKSIIHDHYALGLKPGTSRVVLNHVLVLCTGCGGIFPMSSVGMRNMPNGDVTNQPRCKPCRSVKSG